MASRKTAECVDVWMRLLRDALLLLLMSWCFDMSIQDEEGVYICRRVRSMSMKSISDK